MEDRGWRIGRPPSSICHLPSSINPLSVFHHRADVTKAHDVIAEREGSVITHFLGGANKSAERDSREHAAYAYALHPDLRKFRETQSNAREAHQYIHRAIQGAHN